MIPSFDSVMAITHGIGNEAALTMPECELMYYMACVVPVNGMAVEVGCDAGRSSSILAQVAAARPFHVLHIDPFLSPEIGSAWIGQILKTTSQCPSAICLSRTVSADWLLDKLAPFDFAYIDGDHEYDGVKADLILVASRVKVGGILAVHDCREDSLPGVWKAVNEWIDDRWEKIAQEYTLAIWRRLQ